VFFLKQKSSVVGCSWWEGLLFGTNFILHEAVLKRSTSMSSDLLTFSTLPKPYLPEGAYFRLASDYMSFLGDVIIQRSYLKSGTAHLPLVAALERQAN
jgi:hypothetical protein